MPGNSFHGALSRAPMLRLVLPFITGLAVARAFHFELCLAGAAAVVIAIAWFAVSLYARSYAQRWTHGALLMPVLLLFGMCWQELHAPERACAPLVRARGSAAGWDVQVEELISVGARSARLRATARGAIDSLGTATVHGGLLLTVMLDSGSRIPAVGDELLVRAVVDSIDRVPDPGGFDQRTWAATYGIFHQAFAAADAWVLMREARGYASFFAGARQRIVRWLERSDLDARERGMVKAILLGIRDELDSDQKTAFARSGTMHVLAVSGSHVALIYGALLLFFRPLGERKGWKWLRACVMLIVLWLYAGITGATPSVLRATATFTLFCVADLVDRRSDPVNSLAAAAFMLLLWDPIMLAQLSFQLSFLAVLGIALFYRPLMHLWVPPNRVLYYCWSLFSVSIAAQLMTTPLALLSFQAFPVWFLPANMVIVGLVAIGVWGGASYLVLRLVPVVNDAATGFMVLLLKVISWTANMFAHLPGAYPAVRINAWQCITLYALVLLLAAWLFERWNWARTGVFMMVLTLLVGWGWKAHARNNTRRFVVYDERDHLTCAVEQGRVLVVFTDTLDQWTRRKVQQHQRSIGALEVDTVPRLPARLTFDGRLIRLLSGGDVRVDTSDTRPTALVVLTDDARYDPLRLQRLFQPQEGFVLASTMSAGKRAFLREWGQEQGVPVHDVRVDGAYVR